MLTQTNKRKVNDDINEREHKKLKRTNTLVEIICRDTEEKLQDGYDIDTIVMLIEAGANVNAIDNESGQPLIIKLVEFIQADEELQIPNAIEVFNIFKAKGVDLTATDRNGNNILHMVCFDLTGIGVKKIKKLIDGEVFASLKNKVNSKDKYAWEILFDKISHETRAYAQEEYLSSLKSVDLMIDEVHLDSFNKLNNVLLLAHPEFIYPNEVKGFAAAIAQGYNNIVNLYKTQGYDINQRFDNGDTLLHMASRNGDIQLYNALLKLGADYTIRNNDQYRARECANSKADWFINRHYRMVVEDFHRGLMFSSVKPDLAIKTFEVATAIDESQIETPMYLPQYDID